MLSLYYSYDLVIQEIYSAGSNVNTVMYELLVIV